MSPVSPLGAFHRSPLGAFYRTPLGARGPGVKPGPETVFAFIRELDDLTAFDGVADRRTVCTHGISDGDGVVRAQIDLFADNEWPTYAQLLNYTFTGLTSGTVWTPSAAPPDGHQFSVTGIHCTREVGAVETVGLAPTDQIEPVDTDPDFNTAPALMYLHEIPAGSELFSLVLYWNYGRFPGTLVPGFVQENLQITRP